MNPATVSNPDKRAADTHTEVVGTSFSVSSYASVKFDGFAALSPREFCGADERAVPAAAVAAAGLLAPLRTPGWGTADLPAALGLLGELALPLFSTDPGPHSNMDCIKYLWAPGKEWVEKRGGCGEGVGVITFLDLANMC